MISKLNKTKQKRVNKRSSSIMNIFFLSLLKKNQIEICILFSFSKKNLIKNRKLNTKKLRKQNKKDKKKEKKKETN